VYGLLGNVSEPSVLAVDDGDVLVVLLAVSLMGVVGVGTGLVFAGSSFRNFLLGRLGNNW
jgi:hypothetical protein